MTKKKKKVVPKKKLAKCFRHPEHPECMHGLTVCMHPEANHD
jgi:hypothetical protein